MSILFSNVGCGSGTRLTPTATPGLQTPSRTPTRTPTASPTPNPFANVDASTDLNRLSPNGPVIVKFNTDMDPSSSRTPLLSFPSVEGKYTWSDHDSVLTFLPSAPLNMGQTYTFFLDPALRTSSGSSLGGTPQWTAWIDSGPAVVSQNPSPGLTDQRMPVVEVAFDRAMDKAKTLASLTIKPEIPYKIKWKNALTLQIQLTEPFEPGIRYEFLLAGKGADESATGLDGLVMNDDYLWTYSLAPLNLKVTTVSKTTIDVDFNYPLITERTGYPFEISPRLDGKWTWETNQKARFVASAPLPLGRQYAFKLTAPVIDSFGKLQPENPERFFTPLVPVTISDGIRGSDSELSRIEVQFDLPVDHSSAEQAFSISPSLPGYFTWSQIDTSGMEKLWFFPSREFDSNTSYTITIAPSVKSSQGERILYDPLVTKVNTYYLSDESIDFGWGPDYQVIDANGARRLQFISHVDDSKIRFELYPYSLDEFSRLYANQHGDRHDWPSSRFLPVPEDGEQPAASWPYVSYHIPSSDYGGGADETSIPADVPSGLYILNALYRGQVLNQLFLVISENTLVIKRSGDNLFVWLSDINGQSVPGAEIRLHSITGSSIEEGLTSAAGIFHITRPDGFNPMFVSARVRGSGREDVTIAGLSSAWGTGYYDYYFSSDRMGSWASSKYLTYIYTDRPIYRPGQTVNFKVITRVDNDVKYDLLPTGTPVTMNIRDARRNLLETIELKLNEFGSLSGSFQIIEDAMLGNYSVEAVVGGQSDSRTFKVQDYRKPDFQVSLTPAVVGQSNHVVIGDTLTLNLHADYYFGEPVANQTVFVKASSQSYYYYSGGWDETDSISLASDPKTDEQGNATITAKSLAISGNEQIDDWRNGTYTGIYAIQATVDDGSNQNITATYILIVHPAAEMVSLKRSGYFHTPGEAFELTATVIDLDGRPVADRSLELDIETWNSNTYRNETWGHRPVLKTDASGRATWELTFPSGYYDLAVSGTDESGNSFTSSTWIAVFHSSADWISSAQNSVGILAEQDSYGIYDTARLVIKSPFSGPALLTFERGSVLKSMPIELTAPMTVVETQIVPDFAPNIFVTVNVWQPAPSTPPTEQDPDFYNYWSYSRVESYLRVASVELTVTGAFHPLDVRISTDRPAYAPGREMEVSIDVSDYQGKPVQAEVSLALVDESIFALSDELSPDIFSAFYGERSHRVRNYTSLSPRRVLWVGGRGSGGDGAPPPGGLRSEFLDTAAWFPSLLTDKNGRVTATLNLPDNLTSWRLTARAITTSSKVGEAVTNVVTTQELMIRPTLPRVLTTGDRADLVAIVHNNSEKALEVEVAMDAAGLEVQGQARQKVSVEPNRTAPVTWSVVVRAVAETPVTFTAVAEGGPSDAVQVRLPIQPAATADVQTQSGAFSGNLMLTLSVPKIEPETSRVRLQLTNNQAGTLLTGLEYLTGYPYGCIEQTMSRALPNAVVSRAGASLGIGGPEMKARVDPLVQASIQKLYSMQHIDGGWGWWYDDASDDYQTAWVLFGLALIRDAGYSIDPAVIDRGVKYVSGNLETMDKRTRAYALYSLALNNASNEESLHSLLDTSISELDPFSQAALALALYRSGEASQAGRVLDLLLGYAAREGDQLYWRQASTDGEYHQKTMSSTLRTTALALDAFVAIRPSDSRIPGMVSYLLSQRKGQNGWGTTNETSFTILALTDYLLRQKQASNRISYQASLNGQLLQSGVLEGENGSSSVDIPTGNLQPGQNTLTITSDGDSPVYYDLSAEYKVILEDDLLQRGTVAIARNYVDLASNRTLTAFTSGQLVLVQVTVTVPRGCRFLLVEDHLPGGLEAINEGLSATNIGYFSEDPYWWDRLYFWENYGYNNKQIFGDRVTFFVTNFSSGQRTFTYTARATTAGVFLAMPAEASAMYDLSTWGRSASDQITISAP